MSVSGQESICLHVSATKMSGQHEKKYQDGIFNKILKITNGLFNGNGGKLTLLFDTPTSPPSGHIKEAIRKIEQKTSDFTGVVTLVYDLTIVKKPGSMEINVAKSNTNSIFTLHYNIYLPTNQQVIEVSPKDPVMEVRDILCMNIPALEAVKPGSHVKEFTLGVAVDFGESKTVQFKQLLEKRTNNVSITKRLLRSGKLLAYVSAFANYGGGHVFIGINDDGKVEGEKITLQDRKELQEKIGKAIGSMVWPDNSYTQSEEEKLWQINFVEVKDARGGIVPSTFVIVIYVAQCLGGVFTKEPESYEIINNEPRRIDFPTWRKLMIEGLGENEDKSDEQTNDTHYKAKVDEILTELLNDNCEWSELKKAAENAQTTHDEVDIRLICLSKLIKFCLRKGYYENADKMFKEYEELLPKSSNVELFEIIEQYLLCFQERSKGNYEKSYEIASKCLEKLEKIQPGIVSAAFFVLVATVVNIIAIEKCNRSEKNSFITQAKQYYHTAERHLENVHGLEAARADLKHKIYVNEAMFFSGSCLAGNKLVNFDASVISKAQAQKCFDKSHDIVSHDMFPLSEFREIQYNLAQSDHFYRHCNSKLTVQQRMKKALKFAKRAEDAANDAGLREMSQYAKNRVTSIQEEIENCSL